MIDCLSRQAQTSSIGLLQPSSREAGSLEARLGAWDTHSSLQLLLFIVPVHVYRNRKVY